MNKNKFSTKYLVEMALLVAIILLMAFTPIGYIKTAGLEITLIVVPVAVGAVTLGPTAGAILGGVFGKQAQSRDYLWITSSIHT